MLEVLILLLSPVVIPRTPTDIFPNFNMPVIVVAWQYTGLNPEEMEVRLTTIYERGEYIDVAEERISQTCNRTAIM